MTEAIGAMIDWARPTLLQFGPADGCGCPMEEWIYFGITLNMHFEPTGAVDLYADAGDWCRELTFPSRQAVFDWVDALPVEEELTGR